MSPYKKNTPDEYNIPHSACTVASHPNDVTPIWQQSFRF